MTAEEVAEVTRLIELATAVGQARQKELFRCVDILVKRAEGAHARSAEALLDAARAMLGATDA